MPGGDARLFFFFNDTATTEIYTLSLHDALPISARPEARAAPSGQDHRVRYKFFFRRSEEHTSELQSRLHLVCRLLLEKKNHWVPRGELDQVLIADPEDLAEFEIGRAHV